VGLIKYLPALHHSHLEGVRVYPLSLGELNARQPQEVLVEVAPHGEIPLHKHSVDAEMFIIAGSGEVLSEDAELSGREVGRGAVVMFEREVSHGFKAGADGLVFISRNGGIVAKTESEWDIAFD
jgi:quercetin dioxygenase-like cupin family protein